jgi:hypothetical protein
MNWYSIFYWVTVADGVKMFFNTFAIIFTVAFIVCTIGYFISANYVSENQGGSYETDRKEWDVWRRAWKRMWTACMISMPLLWAGFVFCPSKKDAVVIIAGGAVGNFITSDSSARQIPSELTLLVREKMRSEIKDLKMSDVLQTDTLKDKTKEELIEILKKKQ